MNPVHKQMLEMWIKTTLRPLIDAALRSAIPAELIVGALVGASVHVARTAGWTKEQLVLAVEDHVNWSNEQKRPR